MLNVRQMKFNSDILKLQHFEAMVDSGYVRVIACRPQLFDRIMLRSILCHIVQAQCFQKTSCRGSQRVISISTDVENKRTSYLMLRLHLYTWHDIFLYWLWNRMSLFLSQWGNGHIYTAVFSALDEQCNLHLSFAAILKFFFIISEWKLLPWEMLLSNISLYFV